MLVLSRGRNDKVVFPTLGISVEILRVAGNKVRLGIDAPHEIPVHRHEVSERMESNGESQTGWLAALADARIGPALRAMHKDMARDWTVEALASALPRAITVRSAVATAGGLPGLFGAAVRAADGGGDLRLEAVAALAPVQSLILRCGGALRAQERDVARPAVRPLDLRRLHLPALTAARR